MGRWSVWLLVALASVFPDVAGCENLVIAFRDEVAVSPMVPLARLFEAARAGTPRFGPGAGCVSRILAAAGADAVARLDEDLPLPPDEWRRIFLVDLPDCDSAATCALAERLRLEPAVAWAERDPMYDELVAPGSAPGASPSCRPNPAGFLPDDPLFADGSQWGLRNLGAPFDVRASEAWERCAGNTATVLGLVDTGIDPAHPDLDRRLADGSPRVIARLSAAGGSESPADSLGHGTMVCGVMAALTGNGPMLDGRGVAGMSGGTGGDSAGARIVSVKATLGHQLSVSGSMLARGILLAIGAGARAVNCSFAGAVPSELVRRALEVAQGAGVVVVCGAGNSADARLQYPAAYARYGLAVSVGAITSTGELADFSTRGDQVDVVAPGQDIFSTWLTYANANGSPLRNFASASGTSFAAPFATGMAGLALSLGADLRETDFQELLRRTARDLGAPGRDLVFGSGLADAAALALGLLAPRVLWHGTATAETWTPAADESLRITKSAIFQGGVSIDGDYLARRYEVRARAELPPGALESPEAWVRPIGPGGWSPGSAHEYDYPWGEVVERSPGAIGLGTSVYWIDSPPTACDSCGSIGWVPRAPQDVVLAWTTWGSLDRSAGIATPRERTEISLDPPFPNPAASRVEIRFRVSGSLERPLLVIDDLRGRRVARLVTRQSGLIGSWQAVWNGRGDDGSTAPSGIYLARLAAGGSARARRFAWLR